MLKFFSYTFIVTLVLAGILYLVIPGETWVRYVRGFALLLTRESIQLYERFPVEAESEGVRHLTASIHDFIDSVSDSNKVTRIRNIDISNSDSVQQYRDHLSRILGVPAECTQASATGDNSHSISGDSLVSTGSVGTIRRIHFSLCGGRLESTGLLGIPAAEGSVDVTGHPVVVAIHGTAAGPETLFRGDDFNPPLDNEGLYHAEDYHNSLGTALMENGFVVFAPQLVTNAVLNQVSSYNLQRNELHNRLIPFGMTLHGVETAILMGSLDALEGSEITNTADFNKMGTYGISLGGATAYYLAALDTRIDAAVVSQWAEDRDGKLTGRDYPDALWDYHWTDYAMLSGYSRYFDDVVLAGLVLPRGLFIEAGAGDGHRAVMAEVLYENLMDTYSDQLEQPNRLCFEYGDGGHEVLLNGSLRWLRYMLLESDEDLDEFC